MSEKTNTYSLASIHLPQRKTVTKRLQELSFILNDIVLAAAFLFLVLWIIHAHVFNFPVLVFFRVYPLASVLFIFSGLSLLFSAKKHVFNPQTNTKIVENPWSTWIPILLGTLTAALGLLNVTHLNNGTILQGLYLSQYGGFCFFLIGLALIPPHTTIPHRFHITQALVFTVLFINSFTILETFYQLLSAQPIQHIIFVPLGTAILFAFFCIGVICRWSNRGFFGNFTLDTMDSTLALRLLVINLFTAPLIGFGILFLTQNSGYNIYQIATLIITCITIVSIFLGWINIKFLYKYDLEHFLMRESLRVHNIDLKMEKASEEAKSAQLAEEKQKVVDKLSYQSKFRDVAEKFE